MWVVTGASGFVGSAALAALSRKAQGPEVVGLVRSGRSGSHEPVDSHGSGVAPPRTRVVDTWTPEALREALRGATGVVHAASVVHRPDAPDADYIRFNVEGTRMLVEAAKDVGVSRFVFLSSIKVHGEDTTRGIDPETPLLADNPYARTKIEAEEIVRSASSLRPALLRLCPVYGVGEKGNVRMMIRAIARRRFVLPGGGRTRKSIVHVSTVSDVIHAALRSERTGTFVVADRETPSIGELSRTIARMLGRRPPLSIPATMLEMAAGGGGRALRAMGRQTNLSATLIRKAMTDSVCDSRLTETAFDVSCRADLEAKLREEIAWMRSIGDLG